MVMQRVTVELPEAVFQQLVRIAEATSQPLEILAAQSITSNLPPDSDNAPPEMQAELLRQLSLRVLPDIIQADRDAVGDGALKQRGRSLLPPALSYTVLPC